MIFYILLALAVLGLAAILTGNYMRRDAWVAGPVVSILAGMALVGLAGYVAFAPGSNTSADLSEELARAKQSIVSEQRQIATLKDELISLNKQRVAEVKLRQALLEAQEDRYRSLFDDAVAANPQQERVYAANEEVGPATARSLETGHKRLEDQIARLKRALSRSRAARAEKPARDIAGVMRLKDQMAFGYETKDFRIEPYPDNEVVKGRKGRYYVVDMKNAQSGIRFNFQSGRYTIDRSGRAFRQALSAFARDVAKKLEGNVDYELYVRGSADAAAYNGQPERGFEYNRVSYMPAVGDGRYVKAVEKRSIGRKIKNADLPYLRAEFLRNVVRDVYPVKPPQILEGTVTRKINNADRNVELILFADW